MSRKKLILIVIIVALIYIIGIVVLLVSAFQKLDQSTIAAIIGGLVGALGGVLGAVIVALVTIWEKIEENDERTKDRVSEQALELTKLDYQLRQQSLSLSNKKQLFLAPTKVYRELYKALYDFQTNGNWPKNIEELGLLNIFELGANKVVKSKSKKIS
jgi:hypothetical protein